jgi:hypothetical protein
MTADEYLKQVIHKYSANPSLATTISHQIYPTIKAWGGEYLVEAIWSGSIAKGTTVSLSSDADVFISISSTCTNSLADVFNTLNRALNEAGYATRKQNVSIRVTANGCKIDYTPGKRQSPQGYDHSIYKSKLDSWTKTNVKTQASVVKESGRTREIKLCKIWRELHRLEFPSFYLELAVIDCLSGKSHDDLSGNFMHVFGYFSDNFVNTMYYDPSNTNNRVSDDLTAAEKLLVRQAATNSRSKGTWGEIVW